MGTPAIGDARPMSGAGVRWRRLDSNQRPRAYESPALPLSYVAILVEHRLHSTQEPQSDQGSGYDMQLYQRNRSKIFLYQPGPC